MAWFLVKLQLFLQPPDRPYSSPTYTVTHRPTPSTASASKFLSHICWTLTKVDTVTCNIKRIPSSTVTSNLVRTLVISDETKACTLPFTILLNRMLRPKHQYVSPYWIVFLSWLIATMRVHRTPTFGIRYWDSVKAKYYSYVAEESRVSVIR